MRKLVTFLLLSVLTKSFGQRNKTFTDSIFQVGDIVQTPEIVYYLDGDGHENDSTLKKIADFVNSHKGIVFQLGSHTDSRGGTSSNFTLSVARAQSIKQALVSNFSVDAKQIQTKGYGSSKPLKTDAEISKAETREEKENLHALNRRTELKVIEIKN
jgi:hypothetical protein